MKQLVYLFAAMVILASCSKEPEQVEEQCDEPEEWCVYDLNKMQDEGKWKGPQNEKSGIICRSSHFVRSSRASWLAFLRCPLLLALMMVRFALFPKGIAKGQLACGCLLSSCQPLRHT